MKAVSKFLIINLSMLRRYKLPASPTDIQRQGPWSSYSTIHSQLSKLIHLGFVTWSYTDDNSRGSPIKKFYILTIKGKKLLDLLSEEDDETDLEPYLE